MKCFTPKSREELAAALSAATERTRIVAGGTDYVIASRKNGDEPDALIHLGSLPEAHAIAKVGKELRVGAMATMAQLAHELAENNSLRAIADAASDVGSPQIRNKGTWIGNLCNASPAGDMLPVSWLYDAALELLDGTGELSRIPVVEFILGPKKTALHPGQIVLSVIVDAARWEGWISAFHKIGSRERVSISREGLAALIRLNDDETIAEARLTLGAVANTPIRVPEAEEYMLGRRLGDEKLPEEVTAIVSRTVHDNCRPANRMYKTEAARGLTADVFDLLKCRAEP